MSVPPSLVEISAEAVAKQSIRAFDRGRALLVPGWVMWVPITIGRLSPYVVLRHFYGLGSRWLRWRAR